MAIIGKEILKLIFKKNLTLEIKMNKNQKKIKILKKKKETPQRWAITRAVTWVIQKVIPRKTIPKMNLGEDNKFYFHEELKIWVEKGKEEEYF